MRPRNDRLRRWALGLYEEHGPAIASIVGSEAVPPIRVEVAIDGPGAAWTNDDVVTLNARWFAEHPDDVGGCLHEFAHAIMRAPTYDDTTGWLIEGVADHVRNVLGFEMSWTAAHFEPGGATAGYQTTAHFLAWLEASRPGIVRELSRRLSKGTYAQRDFEELAEEPLPRLVAMYEEAN